MSTPTYPETELGSVPRRALVAGGVRRDRWLVFLLLATVALGFALYTRHVWEDFYITYRASKNLATGVGLTFTAGERVHSFTSPLGTLLPALASLMTGNTSDTGALWIFRLMSIAAYAAGGVLLWNLARRLFVSPFPAVFLVALLATDAKTIDFTVNGMETPYVVLFLAWTLHGLLTFPERRALHLGLAWAGLMWSRPDSFIYIGGLTAAVFLFGRFPARSWRRVLLKDCLVAGLITVCLYGPWLTWAWWYYGSPVPHTVVAKKLSGPEISVSNVIYWLKDFPGRTFHTAAHNGIILMPPYSSYFGVSAMDWAARIAGYLIVAVMLVWLLPWVRWEARVSSFVVMIGQFYFTYLMTFPAPWYMPTVAVLVFFTLATISAQISGAGWLRRGLRSLMCVVPIAAAVLLLCTAFEMRLAQRINETGHRRVMAEWLKANSSSPKETVFIECLGYVGFFSNLKMYDFPGLSSPEVVKVRRESPLTGTYTDYFPEIISALEPDWVVLRQSEVYLVGLINRDILGRYYHLARIFDTRAKIDAIPFLPGRGYLEFDSHFEVYRRNNAVDGPPGTRVHIPAKMIPIMVESLTTKRTWAGPAYNSQGRIAAHSPSTLALPLPAGVVRITGQLGFFPGSFEQEHSTEGAVFTINAISRAGARTTLFSRTLEPHTQTSDRGDQEFVAPITTGDAATIEFVIEPLAGKSNAFGWTYWTNLKFEIPKG